MSGLLGARNTVYVTNTASLTAYDKVSCWVVGDYILPTFCSRDVASGWCGLPDANQCSRGACEGICVPIAAP